MNQSIVCLTLITALNCLSIPLCFSAENNPSNVVRFCAMGDTPYKPEEYVTLPQQIARLPDSIDFAVHVGDIKRGVVPCEESIYDKVSQILTKSKKPLFIIPGDNEWNDCPNPDEAWPLWNKYFMKFDEHWQHQLNVVRQPIRLENFSFTKQQVLFLGINIVGGKVQDAEEWKTRHQQDLNWIQQQLKQNAEEINALVLFGHAKLLPGKHSEFIQRFEHIALEFKKPILYLHGDGHFWIKDRPFKAQNILRVQVDQGAKGDPVLVTVNTQSEEPFQFDRRK